MNVFITGGTGFIGSHVLHAALQAGHRVTALRRTGSTPKISLPAEPRWVEGALRDDWQPTLSSCDALIHLAAVGVSPQRATWEELFQTNVIDSVKLWRSAVAAGVKRVILCGSCFEYGRSGERYEFIPVQAPLEPTNPYAASKAAATMAAAALAAESPQTEFLLLRPFHLFGAGQHPENLWPSLRTAALAGNDFETTPGEQVRDFMPVARAAEIFVAALTRPDLKPGSLRVENIGTGQPQTVRAFVTHWWQQWHAAGQIRFGAKPYRPAEVMRFVPQID